MEWKRRFVLWIHRWLNRLGLVKRPWRVQAGERKQRRRPRTITIDEQGTVTVEAPTAATILQPATVTRTTPGKISIELPSELVLEGERLITVREPTEVVIEGSEISLIEQTGDGPDESGPLTVPYPETVTIFEPKTVTIDLPREG